MTTMRQLASRLRALVRRAALDNALDEEVRTHLERETERNVAAGMSPDDARYAARRAFGNIGLVREDARDAVGWKLADQFSQDMRYAARTLRRAPTLTLAIVVSLALGIGANTAIFSVVDALMLRTLPVREPERLVTLEQTMSDGSRQPNYAFPDYDRFRTLTSVFAGVAAVTWMDGFNVAIDGPGGGIDDAQARISIVTGNFFDVLGVRAHAGRTFGPEDDRELGGHPVVVISDAYWARRLARASDVIGRRLTLNGIPYTIVGVTPPGFAGDWVGWPTDLWFPVAMQYQVMPQQLPGPRGGRVQWKLLARLQPGATIEQARAAGSALHHQLVAENPPVSGVVKEARFEVMSAARGYSTQREAFSEALIILMGLVVAVLLIACANIANLLLARAAARQRETAVRMAIGAGRRRLIRQLFTESALLAILGGVAGVGVAWLGMKVLSILAAGGPAGSVTTTRVTSVVLDLRMDVRALAFTAALCVLTCLMFGVMPALRGSAVQVAAALGGRGAGASHDGLALRKVFVITQVALSIVLIAGAALFVRTLENLRSGDLGLDRNRVLLAWTLPAQTGRPARQLASLFWTVQERLAALPGVVGVSATVSGVLSGSTGGPLVRGDGAAAPEVFVDGTMTIAPKFFETLGQRVIDGREFTRLDSDSATRPVVIINASLARYLFGSTRAVGRRLTTGRGAGALSYDVIGVVADSRYVTPREQRGFMTYWPYAFNGRLPRLCIVVRAAGDPLTLATAVRRELAAIDDRLPVIRINTINDQLDDLLVQDRLIANLSSFFGLVAALLTCVGLYGLASYVTARRTNEIGIRLALGATRAGIVRMVLKQSIVLVIAGVIIGVPAAIVAARVMAARLYGVAPSDPLTMGGVAALLLLIAAIAALIPAYRATKVDPIAALRVE